MKYRVHVYMTVRVAFDGIEAESQAAALLIAEQKAADECTTLRDMADLEGESAEEITGYLVDEDSDSEYQRTNIYNADHTLYQA